MSDPSSSNDLGVDPTILRPATARSALFDDLDFEQTLLCTQVGKRVFGRYVLGRELGRGGMGIVWLARDEILETDVALKFLPDSVARDREAIAELKRETLRSRELRHAGIVGVYEFAQDPASVAIVMEYIDGPTLSELKTEQPTGCFDVTEIAPWIKQLCEVLTYAHEHARVVHRDLKPRNLMLSAAKSIKVADFGIARSVSDSVSRLSMRAHTSGTPPYMSPQQDVGETPRVSDDIYALGATIYDLLTSKPPFYTGNISKQIHEKVPPPIAQRRSELGIQNRAAIPPEWEQLVAACLAKKPEDRPRSAAECLQWIGGQPIAIAKTKSSRRQMLAVAAAIVLLVSGFAAWKTVIQPTARPDQNNQPSTLSLAPTTSTDSSSKSPDSAPTSSAAVTSSEQPESGQSLALQTGSPANILPLQELASPPPAAPMTSNSPVPSPSATPKKQIAAKKKVSGDQSSPASKSSRGNDAVRHTIESQYRRGQLTREQYLNALKNL